MVFPSSSNPTLSESAAVPTSVSSAPRSQHRVFIHHFHHQTLAIERSAVKSELASEAELTCSTFFSGASTPAMIICGLRSVPSKKTPASERAPYTAPRTRSLTWVAQAYQGDDKATRVKERFDPYCPLRSALPMTPHLPCYSETTAR